MEQTLLQASARPLLLLHAVLAIVLIGASTHHLLIALGTLRGSFKLRLCRIYAATAAAAYAATLITGGLAYPTYRYHVRGLYLDRHAVWAANLFDIKECFATIGLPLCFGALLLSRILDPRADRQLLFSYAFLVFGSAAIVWFNVISGLLITMTRGV